MAHKSVNPRAKVVPQAPPETFDKQMAQNEILRGLPSAESEAVYAKIEFAELPVRTVLNQITKPIEFCYFVNGGLASILNVMADGKSVEVGLSGKEGFVGLPILVGYKISPTQAVMQIGGSAFRVRAKDLTELLRECPQLEKALSRYAQELALQGTQIAACNRLHGVEQRMARWLLMSADRMDVSEFPLTQEFLAHMLGTRRASVTTAAGILQRKGLITYKRGQVKITNRSKLENACCECYSRLVQQLRSWRNGST
jgi:CRP-like cAMP-binding protein